MTKPLSRKRIAVAGGRKFDELASIIAKQDGEAVSRPMMGSVSNDSIELADIVHKVCQGADWFVLVTGVGTRALLEKAKELGLGEQLHELLANANIAARGYKTFNALKELGLKPIIIDDDGTVEGVRRQLESFNFSGKRVAVQLHGERMPTLTDWLLSQGAMVTEIPLYFYEEPSERDVQQLLYEVLSGAVDVVAFTSNTQVKFFFEGVRRLKAESFLQKAFNERVIALSVGSMTSAELRKNGITRIVAPEHERMGAMVMALAKHYQLSSQLMKSSLPPCPPASYPIVLTRLSRVAIIGGGKVAERKVKSLLEANVKPTVISPELTKGLLELKTQNSIIHFEKAYEVTDLQNMQMVIAATDDAAVNQQIAGDAGDLLCNVVDNPELGNVHSVGAIRRGDLLVMVSSNGKSPALTRYVKEDLEDYLGKYEPVLEAFKTHRERLKTLNPTQRNLLIHHLLDEPSMAFEEQLEKIKQGLHP